MLYIDPYFLVIELYLTPWRNGSASDSRSEGCVFESRRGQKTFFLPNTYISLAMHGHWPNYYYMSNRQPAIIR